jgi:hypothetical protein|tara:strand:+ start:59271 stop:60053 length:783 start_codon:yes stop_codon:yes gene_type:complete
MPKVETATLAATCGHSQTGSSTVKANGNGVSRVGIDKAVGLIDGPGSQSVFVEGYSVSLPGDLIVPHAPCGSPSPPHCNAKTNLGGTANVFAGIGFTIGPGGGIGEPTGLDAPDLKVTNIEIVPNIVSANHPTINETHYVGTIDINYTIQNFAHEAEAFNIGLWKTPNEGPWILHTEDISLYPAGVELLETDRIEGIAAGAIHEGSITLTSTPSNIIQDWSINNTPVLYVIYPDIDKELIEPDEDNSALSKPFNVVYAGP